MATREFIKTQIDFISEETLQKIAALISIDMNEIEEPHAFLGITKEQLHKELKKGMDSLETGITYSVAEVREEMQRLYNNHDV